MITVVLATVMSAMLTNADTMNGACTNGCNCDLSNSFGIQLTIDCSPVLPHIEEKQLLVQLDSLLSADHIRERLTSLTTSNTPLTHVPTSVCGLFNLTTLNLSHNKLTELPDDCFTRLSNLVTLLLSFNSIAGLQNGLFVGLQNLVTLDLSFNRISFIGLGVFSNESDLTGLRSLRLNDNRLTSLEPWLYFRLIQGSETSYVNIDLYNNMISNFTNQLHFKYRCGMQNMFGIVDFTDNRIAHITDIVQGWDLGGFAEYLCLHSSHMSAVLAGDSYDCDCVDIWYYEWARIIATSGAVRNIRCNGKFHSGFGQALTIPLIEFVCEITDRCPPNCRCVYRPANATLHVYCSAANLSSLPLSLPPLPKSYVSYKLDFSNNKRIRHLERRPYLVSTSALDLHNCSLTKFPTEVLQYAPRIETANFRGNMFQSLPKHAADVNISTKLLVGGNPWRCSCGDSWMIGWLQSSSVQILDPGDVICRSPLRMYGRNFLESTEEDFCVDPVKHALTISLTSVASAAVVIVLFGFVFYKLRIKFYARWKFHPFDRDECEAEEMDYDVFLCCSSDDDIPHARRILELMETNGYRVCYHERDFLPGELITDNIGRSIEHSKRTLCFVTSNFLKR